MELGMVVWAAISAWVLEWLKDKPWAPFIVEYGPYLNRATALVIAVGSAIGITFAFDATAHTLTIGGLDLVSISTLAWKAVEQFVLQQLVYHGWIVKTSNSGILRSAA